MTTLSMAAIILLAGQGRVPGLQLQQSGLDFYAKGTLETKHENQEF